MSLRAFVVVVAWLIVSAARVHAETVALLPLDGEKRLEIYGQPVAAEIGRTLKAQGYEVVVVGAKMDVPDAAQLIVDGTIKADKASSITLVIRIRDPHSGAVLQTLPASAATLTTIDKAAAELSAKLIPAVKEHFAALAKAALAKATPPTNPTNPINPDRPSHPPPVATAPALPLIVTTAWAPGGAPAPLALLASGLGDELPAWAAQHKHDGKKVDPQQMIRADSVKTVQAANAELGMSFEVLTYAATTGTVPMARARVRVLIAKGGEIAFERVVVTDTVVGDKGITQPAMAARTAREVLAIVNAQLRRLVVGWQ